MKGVENNGCLGSCNNNGGEWIDDFLFFFVV